MTRNEAIMEYVIPAIVRMWNEDTCDEIIKALKHEPKTGHWITEDMFDGEVAYRCSVCGELFWIVSGTPKTNEYNFCPKCGIRLIEPQESEDKDSKTNKRGVRA